MASKRKLEIEDTSDSCRINKKINIGNICGEDTTLDSSLQLVNDDIAHIIVDFLKANDCGLVSLSLTCSRWHNFINPEMDKDLRHAVPLSYKEYSKARRNQTLQKFYSRLNSIADVQLFEFQEETRASWPQVDTYAVPWAPHIIFIKVSVSFAIFDLQTGKVIQPFTPDVDPTGYGLYTTQFTLNTRRKQVVIANTIENEGLDDRDFHMPEHYEWLHVYNVDDSGSVEFVTKFCVAGNHAVVYNEYDFSAPPSLLLTDDGIIWHSVADSLHRFSIEKNCELSVVFDFHELQIMGMGVVDNRVVIFCSDYEGSPISVYDTTAKEFIGELPNSDVHTEGGGDQEIEMRVVVRNNLALLTDYTGKSFVAVYGFDPLRKLYPELLEKSYVDHYMSQDCTKFVKVTKKEISVHNLDAYHSPTREIPVTLLQEGVAQFIENSNKIFYVESKNVGVIDESVTEINHDFLFELPMKDCQDTDNNVSIVGNKVFIGDRAQGSRRISIYKLTLRT